MACYTPWFLAAALGWAACALPARALDITPGETEDQSTPSQSPAKPPKYLEEGLIPNSIRLPGTDLSLKIGGYVKLDFIQDFQSIGNRFQFKTDTIPVRGATAAGLSGQTTLHARETRLLFDLSGQSNRHRYRAYFEGDFYGDNNSLRIRHAYGEFGNLLGGQTWSTFMDITARPRPIDYEGPDAEVFVRQAMLRWTQAISPRWKFAIAAEESSSQFAIPAALAGEARSRLPDFPAFLRYEQPRGHFQVATILRQLRFDGIEGQPDAATLGWGVNSTFRLNTQGKSGFMGQAAFGSGIGRYIESMAGQNVDAVFRPGNRLYAIPARALVLGYEQHWNPKLFSSFALATTSVSPDASQPASTIRRTRDTRASLIYSPYRLFELGGELMWGRRDNFNGAAGQAWRFQFALIYYLNR